MRDHGDFLVEYCRRRAEKGEPVKNYLEIGCQADYCFSRIVAEKKIGVDPLSGGTHRMTSDAFFEKTDWTKEFLSLDLVFIDGDHEHRQVLRDIKNAGYHLAPGGLIAMHDCLPPNEQYTAGNLCHDSYRAFLVSTKEWNAALIPSDYGIGLLRRPEMFSDEVSFLDRCPADISYQEFIANYLPKIRQMGFREALEWSLL